MAVHSPYLEVYGEENNGLSTGSEVRLPGQEARVCDPKYTYPRLPHFFLHKMGRVIMQTSELACWKS